MTKKQALALFTVGVTAGAVGATGLIGRFLKDELPDIAKIKVTRALNRYMVGEEKVKDMARRNRRYPYVKYSA